jgi:hypothetical protein
VGAHQLQHGWEQPRLSARTAATRGRSADQAQSLRVIRFQVGLLPIIRFQLADAG